MPDFAKGIFYKEPSPKAPDFVVGGINIKREEFIEFLSDQKDEWVNLKILLSKEKKPYIVIDDWKPKKNVDMSPKKDDLPF